MGEEDLGAGVREWDGVVNISPISLNTNIIPNKRKNDKITLLNPK